MTKPKEKMPKEPKKKLVKKIRVNIKAQHKDFNSQAKAREWAREILAAPIYFVNVTEIEVEE